jgi:hypothetical protein
MAEIVEFKPQALKTFIVTRSGRSALPYLSKEGEAYRWVNNVHKAVRFNIESDAEDLALRVAGGAVVAELIEA